MKNHYVLSLKLQAQSSLHKDYSASSYSKDNKLQLRSPIKIEDSCSSARNSKRSPNNRPYVYEPVKSGSFVSSLLSPNARYSNVGNFGLNANKPSLNHPKNQDKQISEAENYESSSKPGVSENPLANNYRDGLRSRENPLAHKDGVISPTGKSSLQESLKSNSVSNYYNLGSNLSGLAAEKNFSLEEAAERKASPPSRVIADYLSKVNSKHGGSKTEGGSTIKASLQASYSPKKSFLDHGKSKLVTSMVKKENLLTKLKSENIPHHEDTTKPLVSPSYKKDSFFRQQQQQQQNSMFGNTSVTNIAGVSSPARKIESQTTKGYSYLRDRTNPKVDERPTGHFNLKKEEKPGDDLLNRYFKNRQRPDSSFDKHHVHSIKSVDFYQSSWFGAEPRLSNSKILKTNQLDSMDAEDNKGKNESIISGKATDEWNVLNEKSKKNFLNFHKIFAENNKKVSFNKDDSKNLSKAVASAVKTGEEEIQSVKNLETNSSARDLLNLDRWMTPSSLNEKVPVVVSNSELQESLLDSQQVPLKELGSRRYPNTTKHLERRRIDFTTSFEGQSTNEFESKGLSTTAMYKSGDGDSDSMGINRSMTPMQNDKSGSWVKKRKSRTLINDELEEKIAQLEKKRIDLYQGHQANDVLKNLYSRTTVGKHGESALSSRSGDKTEKGSAVKEAKMEELKTEGQLKTLYMRVKEGFEKMKAEKSAWVEERSQLLGKIDTLEKTVLDLRERLTISDS